MQEIDEETRDALLEEPSVALEQDEVIDQNLLEQLRQRRKELFENRSAYISITGYEDLGLVCQYKLLDSKEMDRIAEKVRRQVKNKVDRGMFTAVDTFIEACEGLYLEREGAYVPFDPNRQGFPLKYEPALAEFLGFSADSARKVVFGLFGDNDAAIAGHAMRLQRWFMNTSREADEDLLGES